MFKSKAADAGPSFQEQKEADQIDNAGYGPATAAISMGWSVCSEKRIPLYSKEQKCINIQSFFASKKCKNFSKKPIILALNYKTPLALLSSRTFCAAPEPDIGRRPVLLLLICVVVRERDDACSADHVADRDRQQIADKEGSPCNIGA